MINKKQEKGFTLIETLVAITVLMLAVIAPMSLTVQSLESAYYARDQVTASNLAQEAIEAVRSARDANILYLATCGNTCEDPPRDIFKGIFVDQKFTIDTTNNNIVLCNGGVGPCSPLLTNGTLYGYGVGWTPTAFTRTVSACYIQSSGAPPLCNANPSDEVRLTVRVDWQTGTYPARSITIYENLYRWI